MSHCDSGNVSLQIYQSLDQDLKTMVNSGQVRIEIRNLSPGSVVVDFIVIFSPGQEQDIRNTSTALLDSLRNSSIYTMDENNTSITGMCLFILTVF